MRFSLAGAFCFGGGPASYLRPNEVGTAWRRRSSYCLSRAGTASLAETDSSDPPGWQSGGLEDPTDSSGRGRALRPHQGDGCRGLLKAGDLRADDIDQLSQLMAPSIVAGGREFVVRRAEIAGCACESLDRLFGGHFPSWTGTLGLAGSG